VTEVVVRRAGDADVPALARLREARAASSETRADGYEQLVLNPRPHSRPFYERLGFRSAAHLVVLPL